MKRKVLKAEQQENGTLLTYEDGTTEFLEGVTVQLNKQASGQKTPQSETDEENLLDQMRK